MKRSRWYAIRVAPGYQRMAAVDERLPECRRMKFIIERNCRKDGFDIFMPSFYNELRHHRTKQILQKRCYAFVNLPRLNFGSSAGSTVSCAFSRRQLWSARISPCDHRGPLLRRARAPASLPLRAALLEGERAPRADPAPSRAAAQDPAKGRKARVSMVDQRRGRIDSLSPQIKKRVQKIVSELNALTG